MKVFKLTDVETPALKERGLINVPIVIGRHVVNPGGEAEVGNDELVKRDVLGFTTLGALSIGVRPPAYLLAQADRISRARLEEAERVAKAMREKKS